MKFVELKIYCRAIFVECSCVYNVCTISFLIWDGYAFKSEPFSEQCVDIIVKCKKKEKEKEKCKKDFFIFFLQCF
jgi:hypothetical protein